MSDRWWWLPFGRVSEIGAMKLKARLDRREPLQLIDVRTPDEYASGHITGAINEPINRLRSTLPILALDPDRPIIAICATAHRSPPAVRVLRRAGFDAQQLRSGMIAWHWAKLPTVKA
jgi:rhodanese-related sulfurtransferase